MDSITGLRYAELEKRPTYEELIDIIVKDFKVKLPDRTASFIYNSPEIQNLLAGDGSSIKDIEEHEVRKYKEEVKEIEIKKQASTSTQTAQQIRTQEQGTSTFQKPQIFDMTLDDRIDDVQDDVKDNLEHHAHNVKQQTQQIANILGKHLREDVTPGVLDFAHKMVTAGKSQSSTDVPYFAQDTPMPSKEPVNPQIPTHTSSNTGPPPPPPAAGAVRTNTTRRVPRERIKSRDDDVMPQAPIATSTRSKPRAATLPPKRVKTEGIDGPATAPAPVPTSVTTRGRPRARVKREVKQEGFAPPPPPPAAPAVTTETTGKPRARSTPATPAKRVKKEDVKKEIKEEVKEVKEEPPPSKKAKTSKGTVPKRTSPYLSQRTDRWWNKQKKADIIKEVERLDGFVATTAQKNSITKADWIRMAKAAGKPDDENNTAQLLKVKVEEGARRSKTKSRK